MKESRFHILNYYTEERSNVGRKRSQTKHTLTHELHILFCRWPRKMAIFGKGKAKIFMVIIMVVFGLKSFEFLSNFSMLTMFERNIVDFSAYSTNSFLLDKLFIEHIKLKFD